MARKYADIVGSTASEVTIKEVRRQLSSYCFFLFVCLFVCLFFFVCSGVFSRKQANNCGQSVDHMKPYSYAFAISAFVCHLLPVCVCAGGAQSEEDQQVELLAIRAGPTQLLAAVQCFI